MYSNIMATIWESQSDNFAPEFWFLDPSDDESQLRIDTNLSSHMEPFGKGLLLLFNE